MLLILLDVHFVKNLGRSEVFPLLRNIKIERFYFERFERVSFQALMQTRAQEMVGFFGHGLTGACRLLFQECLEIFVDGYGESHVLCCDACGAMSTYRSDKICKAGPAQAFLLEQAVRSRFKSPKEITSRADATPRERPAPIPRAMSEMPEWAVVSPSSTGLVAATVAHEAHTTAMRRLRVRGRFMTAGYHRFRMRGYEFILFCRVA